MSNPLSVTLKNVSVAELIEMAEGLTDPRHFKLATMLYRLAFERAPVKFRAALLTRIGLTGNPTPDAGMLRELLRPLEKQFGNVFIGAGLATWSKTLPFFEDERFRTLAEKHAHLLPMPNWHWNLSTVLWAVKRAGNLDGDLVELGVFRGHTTLFCAEYLEFADWPKRWWLYDTFDGIPEDQVDPGWEKVNAGLYQGKFSYEEVRDRFAAFPNVDVVQGRVPEILAERSPDKISFLHVDLNNATAEVAALEALYERIVPGGLIVFDDYGWSTARAQRDAEERWFSARGLEVLSLPTGQGLLVKT